MVAAEPVAYLGPAGTNTEVAALRAYPGSPLVPYPTITAAVRAVETAEVARAVVPIENSLQGTVTETVDLLVHDEGIEVCAEIVLHIEHCLMVRPGTATGSIEVIYSHPQSL